MKNDRRNLRPIWLFSCFLLVFWLFHRQFELAIVSGNSMEPTYQNGDLLFLDKRAYASQAPMRGDILVARYQGDLIVKRVVGIPGEEVEITQGCVFVNGSKLQENYPINPGWLQVGKGKLFADRFALAGDNRELIHGICAVVENKSIVGKVVCTLKFPRFFAAFGASN